MAFIVNPVYASISFGISVMLFVFIMFRTPGSSWGYISQALIFHQVIRNEAHTIRYEEIGMCVSVCHKPQLPFRVFVVLLSCPLIGPEVPTNVGCPKGPCQVLEAQYLVSVQEPS